MHYLLRVCSLLAIVSLFQLATSTYGFISDDENAKSTAANATENRRNSETNPSSRLIMNDVDFDVEFAKKYVDYNALTDDLLVTPVSNRQKIDFNARVLALLNDGEIDEAIASLEQKINEYLSLRSPWGTLKPEVKANQAFTRLPNEDKPLSRYVYLLGLAFELKGNYEEASRAYRHVFDANQRDLAWTWARLDYKRSLDHNDESSLLNAQYAFSAVCSIIQNRYNLPYEDVIEALEYVNTEEAKWKIGPPSKYITPIFLRFPDENQSAWFNALGLYRIRIWCARFICPNLLYKHRIRDNRFTKEEGRVESVQLIRDSYDAFMIFMEEVYAKAMEDGDERSLSGELKNRSKEHKERFTATMAILHKIKELPY